ncbi:tetratricopeptide (TPR) repeat protein [Clostridium acetobutylicum]|uniref:TPR repeats containing protein n=1 Tax=Clostridium acetobutylicum (strain ATCC 824 / DSM 792 / JCM 1419 / IAM 19013 / LMG 5710 / NBRC 13948 / NRRL B-527 / VKM B-1787 / 2291 / W) TaxID=272562 RepID=Q97GN0_CLOAB|nr:MULTISPECIES: hypothetical protein [Clostridium]AAK80292.1 TPR repeats containing protein [Clostridium acetobutylicum ATCC 824]ADZ21387.1 TPR repeats containing protein [Clostridium acetobutylicum EA 2018]AEI32287.1 TPR repeat-containing protein [Clostridium acetobutylicum DSM 1731]AWV79286.1 tetratricopeptide repeat protein [Clostridium acetobutylicum]KHD38472.1 capsular biosynthesis protein [Clostridium acetobutylicum]
MSIQQEFKDKVAKLIFLELKKESVESIFNVKVKENIYSPIRPKRLIDKVKEGNKFENIPLSFFVEGMFYVLGGDENFKFNAIYSELMNKNLKTTTQYIKEIIYTEVKENNYEDAYILLKGLVTVEKNEENYDKIMMISEAIREKKPEFKEEELKIIEKAKELKGYIKPYFYEAIIKNENKDYEGAWYAINTYTENGGEENEDTLRLKHTLQDIRNYENAKEIMSENPKEALKIFIKLLDEFQDDAVLLYYIGVTYRILCNHEKAIYYLNESMSLDSNMVEVFNEMGINYAALGDMDNAISYLRKAFEVTKSIEICTNLIICYMNKGDLNQAKLHYEIAKKLNPEDEIVLKLGNSLEK